MTKPALVSSTAENELREFLRGFEQHSLRALLWGGANSWQGRRGQRGQRELFKAVTSVTAGSACESLTPNPTLHELRVAALLFSTNPHSTAITSMRPGGRNGDAVFVWRGRRDR